MKIEAVSEIINNAVKEGKSREEINAALKAAGSSLVMTQGKMGNALLDIGVGNPEFVTVLDGRLTDASGVPGQDHVYYAGRTYLLDDDGVTLIAMPAPEAPWWAPMHTFTGAVDWEDEIDRYIPDKDMMDRPEYAGKEVVKGSVRYIYDANGNAKYQPKSMADYDRDHQR